jgi:hypothetical protein
MAKTILVPTDFSISSLNMVKSALERHQGHPLIVIFGVGVNLPDGIVDKLFFSRYQLVQGLIPKEFDEACQIVRKRYASAIRDMRVEAFSGFTQAAFQNFIDGNQIEEIYFPTSPLTLTPDTFDLLSFVRNARLPKVSVSIREESTNNHVNGLAQLFTNWN